MEDIYAPPPPEEVARVIAELESGEYDEARRRGRLAYNKKFPHRKMNVEYGLKPRPDRRNTDTETGGLHEPTRPTDNRGTGLPAEGGA